MARIAFPYKTTDPIPGTSERLFRKAIKTLETIYDKKHSYFYIINGIKENEDHHSTEGRNLVHSITYLLDRIKDAIVKGNEIIKYWIDATPNNDYELLKLLRDEVEMLGYYTNNEVNGLTHSFTAFKDDWNRFWSSWFGVQDPFSLDSLYAEAIDIEEYFDNDLSIWDHFSAIIHDIDRLPDIITDIDNYFDYQQMQLEYANKWVMERSKGSDKIFPEGVENVEIMWHVTTACSKVLAEGLKPKKDITDPVGLGGGSSNLISFTASFEHAKNIKEALEDMVTIAKKPPTLKQLKELAKSWGMSDSSIKEVIDIFPYKLPATEDKQLPFDSARYLYELLSTYGSKEGVKYSAMFWNAEQESFAKIDLSDICIIEALVDTTSPETTYHRSEEEWRIPPDYVIDIRPVESQRRK